MKESTLTQTHAESVERINELLNRDDDSLNPLARTILWTHGHKTARTMVFLHGFTNNPNQFREIGQQFFERGYNVFIPRAPYHGDKDRMTHILAQQTVEGLLKYLNESLDMAHGLGDELYLAGFSMGGILSLWAALERSDVTLSTSISPALGFHTLPRPITGTVARLLLKMPNRFVLWNPLQNDHPRHAYPQYPTWGLAHMILLGQQVIKKSQTQKPQTAAKLILNPTDLAVHNGFARQIYKNWQKLGSQNISLYEFDPRHLLMHDLIDPDQPTQKIDVVYPILLDELTRL